MTPRATTFVVHLYTKRAESAVLNASVCKGCISKKIYGKLSGHLQILQPLLENISLQHSRIQCVGTSRFACSLRDRSNIKRIVGSTYRYNNPKTDSSDRLFYPALTEQNIIAIRLAGHNFSGNSSQSTDPTLGRKLVPLGDTIEGEARSNERCDRENPHLTPRILRRKQRRTGCQPHRQRHRQPYLDLPRNCRRIHPRSRAFNRHFFRYLLN